MIYVITPYLTDAVKACEQESFKCPVKAGRLVNKNIMWIYDWQQLLGRKIFKMDLIIWGEKAKDFHPKLYNKIYEEIELRKQIS